MTESLIETIKRELPTLLREDPGLRRYVLEVTRDLYADRDETASRFDRMLEELRRDREAQTRKWEEQDRKSRPTATPSTFRCNEARLCSAQRCRDGAPAFRVRCLFHSMSISPSGLRDSRPWRLATKCSTTSAHG